MSQAYCITAGGRTAVSALALGGATLSEIESAGGRSDRTVSTREVEPEKSASATEAAEAVSGDVASELTQVTESETYAYALAIATEQGPVAVEIELEPLPVRPLLKPSPADAAVVNPAVGSWGRYRLFIITVVLPMIIGAVYLVAVATPRFSSSASLLVRSVTQPGQTGQKSPDLVA